MYDSQCVFRCSFMCMCVCEWLYVCLCLCLCIYSFRVFCVFVMKLSMSVGNCVCEYVFRIDCLSECVCVFFSLSFSWCVCKNIILKNEFGLKTNRDFYKNFTTITDLSKFLEVLAKKKKNYPTILNFLLGKPQKIFKILKKIN